MRVDTKLAALARLTNEIIDNYKRVLDIPGIHDRSGYDDMGTLFNKYMTRYSEIRRPGSSSASIDSMTIAGADLLRYIKFVEGAPFK